MKQTDIYQSITEKILAQLQKGSAPWRKPWAVSGMVPQNLVTKRPYSGINWVLLSMSPYQSPYWVSFKQIRELGGSVLKGAKSQMVVFWKILEYKDKGSGEMKKIPLLRYYNVFNVEQTSGLEGKIPKANPAIDFHPIAKCEELISGYEGRPAIRHGGGDRACYSPALDSISLPEKTAFKSTAAYYCTLFHEVIHSTGAKHRLNREGVADEIRFASNSYCLEELTAEIGAAFLCAKASIDNTFENSVAYSQTWAKTLQNDPKMIIHAAARAQKAVDWIQGKRAEVRDEAVNLKAAA
jgi:antirestriction protein ArdC